MLLLTRKAQQSIIIDDETEIKILSIRGGQVRLGVTAPKDVKVFRKEIIERNALLNLTIPLQEENDLSV